MKDTIIDKERESISSKHNKRKSSTNSIDRQSIVKEMKKCIKETNQKSKLAEREVLREQQEYINKIRQKLREKDV